MHMAVVASIRFEQITNQYNEGANYLRRFLQYAELVSEGKTGAARTILDVLAPRQQVKAAAPTVIRRQLREQLEAGGFEVEEQVGQSGFKCSLAVKRHPEDRQYSLAILIDDEQHYRNGNLIEQYYQRPAILRSFGWTVLPVYAKDWLHQPQKVMEQVWRALGSFGPDGGAAVGAGDGVGTGSLVSASGLEAGPYDQLPFRRLVLDGKYWEAAIDGNQLIVRRGKTGSKGQIALRTFPDEVSAREEFNRQWEEQLRKGYVPAD
jgi:hypothetical protein